MAGRLLLILCFATTINAYPGRWKHAVVKRGVANIATEYDYIVGGWELQHHSRTALTIPSGSWNGRYNGSRQIVRRRR